MKSLNFCHATLLKSSLIRMSSGDERSAPSKSWIFASQVQLVLCQFKFGNQWARMMELFPVKTSNNLKNQFFSITRRCIRKLCRKIGNHEVLSRVSALKSTTLSRFFTVLCAKTSKWNIEETHEETIRTMMRIAFSKKETVYSESLLAKQIYQQTIAELVRLE